MSPKRFIKRVFPSRLVWSV